MTFRSKLNTCFSSYVYDPVQEVMIVTMLSDSAIRRYITHHAFDVKLANVLPGRCKRDLHNSISVPG